MGDEALLKLNRSGRSSVDHQERRKAGSGRMGMHEKGNCDVLPLSFVTKTSHLIDIDVCTIQYSGRHRWVSLYCTLLYLL